MPLITAAVIASVTGPLVDWLQQHRLPRGIGAALVMLGIVAIGFGVGLLVAVVVLLANGVLQQLIQPIAYGAALQLHPLAVLIVTIAGGCLFGTVGLVPAAPLLSAAVRISEDLRAAPDAAAAEGQGT